MSRESHAWMVRLRLLVLLLAVFLVSRRCQVAEPRRSTELFPHLLRASPTSSGASPAAEKDSRSVAPAATGPGEPVRPRREGTFEGGMPVPADVPSAPRRVPRPAPPPVYDFGTMLPMEEEEEDEAPTGRLAPRGMEEWFGAAELREPSRYFELAERMPELNRPEERQDTLEFFLAYRDKLRRDLEVLEEGDSRRDETLETLTRYDEAIERLRPLVGETNR